MIYMSSTEFIFKLSIATIIILGYGGVLITYMIWGPAEGNRTLDTLMGGLSAGYLMVLTNMFGSKQ